MNWGVFLIGFIIISLSTTQVWALTDNVEYVLFSNAIVIVIEWMEDDKFQVDSGFINIEDKWHQINSTSLQILDSQKNKGWFIGTTESEIPFYSTFITNNTNIGKIGVWTYHNGEVTAKKIDFYLVRLF